MQQFQIVLNQVIIFLVILILGFIAVKAKVLDSNGLNVVSRLFTKLLLPFLLFTNMVNGATRADVVEYLYIVPISIGIYVVLIAVCKVMPKLMGIKGNRARLFSFTFTFGNVGFIGIPLLLALFGQKVMVYIAVFTIVDQILLWTYGVTQTYPVGTKVKFDLKTLKNMLNPPLVSVLISFAFVLSGLKLPTVINDAFCTVANASTPLPFIYLGGMIALCDMKKFVRYYELYAGIIVKMVILPILLFIVLRAMSIENELATTTTILLALPSIAMGPMLAQTNGSDSEYATAVVIITTIASLVTLSFVSYFISVVL